MQFCHANLMVTGMEKTETRYAFDGMWPIVVILLSWVGCLGIGLSAREPMIGDEVTHYYLAVTQSRDLSAPTMTAVIPLQDGSCDVRKYPHVILWHYLAAIVLRLTGGSFHAVQLLQSLFWLQALFYSWLLYKAEKGQGAGLLVFVVVFASLPVCLVFSVAFYQDIPAMAQMMAALYYLRQKKLSLSVFFFLLAVSFKETMFVMIPAYFVILMATYPWREVRWMSVARSGVAGVALLALFIETMCLFNSLNQEYYPYMKIRSVAKQLGVDMRAVEEKIMGRPPAVKTTSPATGVVRKKNRVPQIANSPGDLRNPVNFAVYGGILFWVTGCAGVAMAVLGWRRGGRPGLWSLTWIGCGVWYIAVTAVMMRTSPDARFFLPAVPLLLIGLAEPASLMPGRRVWLPVLITLAVLQSSLVLGKIYQLRNVKSGVFDAIEYLKLNPPSPNRIFMYPEGDYRLFPCPHEWYMGYDKLRDFWKANNEQRLAMFRKRKVGAIVIKKWLVAPIDAQMNNLGVYPDFFVKQITGDPRFVKVYENRNIVIYKVPPVAETGTDSVSGAVKP